MLSFSIIDIDKKVKIFNETILNILDNYCPYKNVVCNDKDPTWLKYRTKTLTEEKNVLYKRFSKNNKCKLLFDCLYKIQSK